MEEYAIMTFNLMTDNNLLKGKNFSARAAAIHEMIAELHPDFIGVQELSRPMYPYLQDVFKDYAIFGDARHSLVNDEYCSILYRKDKFALIGGSTLWLSHSPEKPGSKLFRSFFPRIVTFGYFKDIQTQDFFTVANTHLDHVLASVRDEQAEILARILMERQKGSWLFLTGDFNATHDSDALHIFAKAHLKDVVRDDLGPSIKGIGHKSQPIDHIYVSKGVSVLNVRKVKKKYQGISLSDHYPIIAYIAL
jgi:endonuclease/exonuclease/phosphatase family metal-dependent hydrolase